MDCWARGWTPRLRPSVSRERGPPDPPWSTPHWASGARAPWAPPRQGPGPALHGPSPGQGLPPPTVHPDEAVCVSGSRGPWPKPWAVLASAQQSGCPAACADAHGGPRGEPPGLRLGEAPGGGTSPLLTAAGPQVPVHQAAAGGAGALAHSGSGWEHPAKPRGAGSGTPRRPSPGALGPDDFAWGCTGQVAGRPSPPAPLPDRDGRASRPPAPRGDSQSQPRPWRASWGLGEASRGQAGGWAQPGTDGWPRSRVGDEAPSGHP